MKNGGQAQRLSQYLKGVNKSNTMEQRSSFQQMVPDELDMHMKKINLDTDLMPFTRINPKWITDLNVKHNSIKLPEDNIKPK